MQCAGRESDEEVEADTGSHRTRREARSERGDDKDYSLYSYSYGYIYNTAQIQSTYDYSSLSYYLLSTI